MMQSAKRRGARNRDPQNKPPVLAGDLLMTEGAEQIRRREVFWLTPPRLILGRFCNIKNHLALHIAFQAIGRSINVNGGDDGEIRTLIFRSESKAYEAFAANAARLRRSRYRLGLCSGGETKPALV